MDQKLIEHTMEQLRGKATSDMVCFNALAIIEALMRGEDPAQAAPRRDHFGEAVKHKHAPAEAAHEAPKRGRRK